MVQAPGQLLSPRDVLAASGVFDSLPAAGIDEMAAALQRREVSEGSIVVWEGEEGAGFYVIASGTAEVWAGKGKVGSRPAGERWSPDPNRWRLVGTLGPGDGFGEMALLLGGHRQATVRAATGLTLYSIDQETFLQLLAQHRSLALALEEEMILRTIATSAGRASPFATLTPEHLRWLAVHLHAETYQPGTRIVRQGDRGDTLYIVRSGHVEVLVATPEGPERQIATLGPGQPFGEQALLSDEPRSATVRAIDPVEVLRLDRADFEDVLKRAPSRGDYFQQLALQRQRPRRAPNCLLERQDDQGTPTYILKDQQRGRYLKLSEQGAFLWELMDGDHTVRDLAVAYYNHFHVIGLAAVVDVMLQLHTAGFVQIAEMRQHRESDETVGRLAGNPLARLWAKLRPEVVRSLAFSQVDQFFSALYDGGFRVFYAPPVQILFLLATALGAALFGTYLIQGGVHEGPGEGHGFITIVAIVAGVAIQLFVHEFAHALTTKHYHREIRHAGVGFVLILPIIFVDISDMWPAKKWARIVVGLAGSYANFLLSGIAMLALPLISDTFLQSLLYEFASTGYLLGLLNLNPLIEFDGYYVLSDWLGIPNLRHKALTYLGSRLWHIHHTPVDRRSGRIFLAYSVFSLLFTVVLAYAIVRGYEGTIEGLAGRVLPQSVAAGLGWAIALLMSFLVLQKAYKDLREGIASHLH